MDLKLEGWSRRWCFLLDGHLVQVPLQRTESGRPVASAESRRMKDQLVDGLDVGSVGIRRRVKVQGARIDAISEKKVRPVGSKHSIQAQSQSNGI